MGRGLGHWSLCCAEVVSGILAQTRWEAWEGLVTGKAEVVWLGECRRPLENPPDLGVDVCMGYPALQFLEQLNREVPCTSTACQALLRGGLPQCQEAGPWLQ